MKGGNENQPTPEDVLYSTRADDFLLDQDAWDAYQAGLNDALRRNYDETVKAGQGAQARYEYDQWDYLKMIVSDIQRGVPVENEDPEIVAIARAFADLLSRGWIRYRAERLAILKR